MTALRFAAASLVGLSLTVGMALPAFATPLAVPLSPVAPAATPDFDGDGNVDIATNLDPFLDVSGLRVRYGAGSTVTMTAQEMLNDQYAQMTGAVLARDFNADGYTDLAFGASSGVNDTRAVYLAFGSASGLQLTALHPISSPMGMDPYRSTFGRALALVESPVLRLAVGGDADGSGEGAVATYDLGSNGLPSGSPTILVPDQGAVPKVSGGADFGAALASSGDQLFIGAPDAKVGSKIGAGALVALTFNNAGVASSQVVTQSTAGVGGAARMWDAFGYSIAARDAYVVVGTPKDDVSAGDTGSVQVFTMSAGKLKPLKRIAQSSSGVPGKDETGDFFGGSVALGTVCSGVPGVIVGARYEKITKSRAGSAWVIPLVKKSGCATYQLYQGHGLSGSPTTQRQVGIDVGVVRDGGATLDQIVIGGCGNVLYAGGFFVWSAATHKTLLYAQELTNQIAGR